MVVLAPSPHCFSFSQKCKSMEEFRQAHAQFLKLEHASPEVDFRYLGNLLGMCALSDWGSMDYAHSIFRRLDDPGSFQFNTMIRGYAKNCDPNASILMYVEMQGREVEPDNFTYPSLLKACSLLSLKEGMQIHGHVVKFGFDTNIFVQNSLISFYGKCGETKLCCKVFELMDQKSVASWSALISSHAKVGLWSECLELFGDMCRDGKFRADESTLVGVLSSCANTGDLNLGRCTHGSLLRTFNGLNIVVETSLIDMYVKCGSLNKGKSLFEEMAVKNKLTYSVMVSGLANHGRAEEAITVFSDMLEEGFEPDDITYVGVLRACSSAGLVNRGHQYFDMMRLEHWIEPTVQHYGCMVDLVARAGMLNEAYEIIKNMPMEPNDVVWRSLLSACKIHGDVKLGEIAADNLSRLDSCNPSDYLLLSNIYAQDQRWDDAAIIRKEAVLRGLNQVPGFSLVEVKSKMHKFVSQDKSHPDSDAVYEMICQMEWQLRFEGYSADTSEVLLFNVDEEEKRQQLSAHSQKLAIAFALIHTCESSTIRIVRNLRMCNDCHKYTRLISKIFERRIIVKERKRFHQFEDGVCSCKESKDYW